MSEEIRLTLSCKKEDMERYKRKATKLIEATQRLARDKDEDYQVQWSVRCYKDIKLKDTYMI